MAVVDCPCSSFLDDDCFSPGWLFFVTEAQVVIFMNSYIGVWVFKVGYGAKWVKFSCNTKVGIAKWSWKRCCIFSLCLEYLTGVIETKEDSESWLVPKLAQGRIGLLIFIILAFRSVIRNEAAASARTRHSHEAGTNAHLHKTVFTELPRQVDRDVSSELVFLHLTVIFWTLWMPILDLLLKLCHWVFIYDVQRANRNEIACLVSLLRTGKKLVERVSVQSGRCPQYNNICLQNDTKPLTNPGIEHVGRDHACSQLFRVRVGDKRSDRLGLIIQIKLDWNRVAFLSVHPWFSRCNLKDASVQGLAQTTHVRTGPGWHDL